MPQKEEDSKEMAKSSRSLAEKNKDGYLSRLEKIYTAKIKVIEQTYSFDTFNSPCLTASEIECKPIILLLGQYSTGKTSFIKYLILEGISWCTYWT